ncbi:hypothetical protein GVN24_12535 [Rhizobium sp. CRIBSB]|nr:hypothetical protein [Rhizobium sp. CRIBSB]
MKADLVIRERMVFGDGAILEVRIWSVPDPVPPSQHRYKYALFYGYPGERLLCYDNERGKGDHRHHGDAETPYEFRGIEQLLQDFRTDVERLRGETI